MSIKKASFLSDKSSPDILEKHFSGAGLLHAYHLVSDDPGIVERLRRNLLGKIPEERAHLDILVIESRSFGIDEARKLRASVSQRAFSGRRFVILKIHAFTEEAQQALLKTMEEPGLGNHFFFITDMESAEALLPTLRSRLVLVRDSLPKHIEKKEVRLFLESAPATRFKLVRKILESEDRTQAEEFFRGIEVAIKENIERGKDISLGSFYREFIRLGEYLRRPSSNLKMILEHIALVCPTIEGKVRESA
mgnify:CR=1 FL=1